MTGVVETYSTVNHATLHITHKDPTVPVIKNSTASFDPKTDIQILNVAFASLGGLSEMKLTRASQGLVMATSLLAILTTHGYPGGHRKLSNYFKIIDSVQFIHYVNGIRVFRGDRFLHMIQISVIKFFPNYFYTDELNLRCRQKFNFDKEQVSCGFLNNFGGEILSYALFGLICSRFTALL